uniref:Follistatin-related protein 5 n=1 Tax=Timema douglasi TaxID=61478 RepID=A0A7R8Z8I7_TIMDO|nr:unnamed protein product [Timema douglasi]
MRGEDNLKKYSARRPRGIQVGATTYGPVNCPDERPHTTLDMTTFTWGIAGREVIAASGCGKVPILRPGLHERNRSFLKDMSHTFKYGYVTHTNQRGLYKLDLANMRYIRSIDLTPNNCVPQHIQFSALYGFVVVECWEPVTSRPMGQILLDYLTDTVVSHKLGLYGRPHVSPNSRTVVTLDRGRDGVTLVVQEVKESGLKFLFDVKTTLNISDITFYPSQTTHGYDLYASATDKEDILFLNLVSGKVEMITGVGKAMQSSLAEWDTPNRPIAASGVFGHYMVTPANEALFVVNGETRTVNCEIGGLVHPRTVVWVTMQLQ